MYTELKAGRSFTNAWRRDAQADPHRHVFFFVAQSDERGLLTVCGFFFLEEKAQIYSPLPTGMQTV